jgi:hypothetical protein
MVPKKASTRSVPITATRAACAMSCWTRWRPAASSRTVPMRAMFSVMPATPTFFWMTRPRFTFVPVHTCAPTSEHRVQAARTAS